MKYLVLFCAIKLVLAGDGSGYNYPKPSISFEEEICPPGSNGVYPHCIHPQPQGKCATGYSGVFPDCHVTEKPKQCPPPTVGTYPNCIVRPCPPGFTGTFPDCKRPENAGSGGYLPPPPTGECTMDWNQFKTAFNKTYADKTEETYRQQIFLHNQEIIIAHNARYEQGLETYSLCVNKFGDWERDEYIGINGLLLSPNNDNNGKGGSGSAGNGNQQGTADDLGEAPDTKDWRKEGAVTPVKDQLKCASCWAFAANGVLEGQFFRKNGVLQSLSEQELIDCSSRPPFFNKGCSYGHMINAFLYAKNAGIHTEAEYPSYDGKEYQCRGPPNGKKNKKLRNIPKGDEGALKRAVGNVGPISVGLDGTHDKFMFYSEGVYFNPDCQPDRISHAVLAIGYDTDEKTGMDYWIIKNSYGTSWGDGGFGKIARNKDSHCGIANSVVYSLV